MDDAPPPGSSAGRTSFLATVLPVAGAIGVFGIVYGAAARPVLGAPLTVVASLVVFSGAAQFSMVSLLATGASTPAVLWAVVALSLRHVALGAAVRPRLHMSRPQRALAAWFLLDESVGLALGSGGDAGRVLVRVGALCYGTWVLGTAVGVAGGAAVGAEELAASVFPVLFIGLASIMARSGELVVRAGAAVVATGALLVAWPGLGGLAPVVAAVGVALPGGRS